MKRIGIALALVGALLIITPNAALAIAPERPRTNFGLKLLDVALVRPLSLVGSIASTAVGLAGAMITFPMGLADEVVTYTVIAPWRFTNTRYIGDFRYYEDGGTITGANIQD
jgi:hypothetical protein